jgi:hypothetical protein
MGFISKIRNMYKLLKELDRLITYDKYLGTFTINKEVRNFHFNSEIITVTTDDSKNLLSLGNSQNLNVDIKVPKKLLLDAVNNQKKPEAPASIGKLDGQVVNKKKKKYYYNKNKNNKNNTNNQNPQG